MNTFTPGLTFYIFLLVMLNLVHVILWFRLTFPVKQRKADRNLADFNDKISSDINPKKQVAG
jgi:hypothetical protein